jgi:hypothetical protein
MSESVKNRYSFLKANRCIDLLILQSIVDVIAAFDDICVRNRILNLLEQRLHSHLRVRDPERGWVLRL